MSGKYDNLSSLNSSSEPSSPSSLTTNTSSGSVKKPFSWTSPSTWSTPSFSGMFKEESCEIKKDKTINAANKSIEKATLDYTACATKRGAPKAAASSGSMLSMLGLGTKPEAPPVKIGGRKKTLKKEKKQKKQKKGKTNKRRTFGWF
jgi:hypothetical protein